MTVIYVPNLIPTIANSRAFSADLLKKLHAKVFNWNWDDHHAAVITLHDFQAQLATFLNHYRKQAVCLILDSFASFIFQPLQAQYPNIQRLVFVNPILKNIAWKTANLKNIMLPSSISGTIYKYMYLFKSLTSVRDDPNWLISMQQEQALIEAHDLVFHKLFDQLFKHRLIYQHHAWLEQQATSYFIVGSHNPLTPAAYVQKVIPTKQCVWINNSGFCCAWEQPAAYLMALLKSVG